MNTTISPRPPPTASTPIPPERLAYLDAIRAFALILGVVFHASLSFLPVFIGWAVQDISTHAGVGFFITVSHSFRMELFFLLAGFFTHMTLQRKGMVNLLRSRIVRIVVPFSLGWFILRPLVVSGWIMGGASMRGDYDFWNNLQSAVNELMRSFPQGIFVGTHLWFLYYIVLITSLVLFARQGLIANATMATHLRGSADRFINWLAGSIWTVPLMAGLIALLLGHMQAWDVDTPDKSLMPNWPVLLLYGGFFGLGWLLQRQPEALIRLSRLSWGRWLSALLGLAIVLLLSPMQGDLGHPRADQARWVYQIGYAVMMWSLVWLTIGVFRRFMSGTNTAVRYVADSSYWMYLIHLPVVIWLQVAVAEIELPWALKWAFVSVTTIGIALITYELFVRSTFIGAILNGRLPSSCAPIRPRHPSAIKSAKPCKTSPPT